MAYQAGGQRSVPRPVPEGPEAQAYLQDCAEYLEAVVRERPGWGDFYRACREVAGA